MQFTQDPVRNFAASANPNNRPDIALGRGSAVPDIALGRGFTPSVNATNASFERDTPYSNLQNKRQEMRGPQNDVDDILSGLKLKTINIHEQPVSNSGIRVEDESMISVSSLKDMANMSVPKRTNRRKNGSEKNTISLGDI